MMVRSEDTNLSLVFNCLLILFQLFQSALDHIHMNIALYKEWNIIIIIIRLTGGLISSAT